MKLTLAAGLFVASASAAASAQAPGTPTEQTLTGCLTSADNIYTLTVLDDKGAPGTTAETTQYTLATGSGIDLQLSGHTHGGQINLGIRPIDVSAELNGTLMQRLGSLAANCRLKALNCRLSTAD